MTLKSGAGFFNVFQDMVETAFLQSTNKWFSEKRPGRFEDAGFTSIACSLPLFPCRSLTCVPHDGFPSWFSRWRHEHDRGTRGRRCACTARRHALTFAASRVFSNVTACLSPFFVTSRKQRSHRIRIRVPQSSKALSRKSVSSGVGVVLEHTL